MELLSKHGPLQISQIMKVQAHHLQDTIEDEKLHLIQTHESCQDDPATYVDESKLRRLSEFVDDEQVGNHVLCMSLKEGYQEVDGDLIRLNKDVIRSKVALEIQDKSKVDGYVQKCAVEAETPEKTAALLILCFIDNDIGFYHKM